MKAVPILDRRRLSFVVNILLRLTIPSRLTLLLSLQKMLFEQCSYALPQIQEFEISYLVVRYYKVFWNNKYIHQA